MSILAGLGPTLFTSVPGSGLNDSIERASLELTACRAGCLFESKNVGKTYMPATAGNSSRPVTRAAEKSISPTPKSIYGSLSRSGRSEWRHWHATCLSRVCQTP